jgi:hypothetical protein
MQTRADLVEGKKKDGNPEVSISKLKDELLLLQTREDVEANGEEKKVQIDLQRLLDKEELWRRQREKEEWLKYGNRNTEYYHACATSKN